MKSILIVLLLTSTAVAQTWDDCFNAVCRVSRGNGRGSGCVFSEDDNNYYVLSNYHVVRGSKRVSLEFWRDGYTSGRLPAEVYGTWYNGNSNIDIAVIAINKRSLSPYTITPIPIASAGFRAEDKTVRSIGCANGNWPTAWEGHVVRDRRNTITFRPPPAGGRSGSAIFSKIDDGTYCITGLIAWRGSGVGIAQPSNKVLASIDNTRNIKAAYAFSSNMKNPTEVSWSEPGMREMYQEVGLLGRIFGGRCRGRICRPAPYNDGGGGFVPDYNRPEEQPGGGDSPWSQKPQNPGSPTEQVSAEDLIAEAEDRIGKKLEESLASLESKVEAAKCKCGPPKVVDENSIINRAVSLVQTKLTTMDTSHTAKIDRVERLVKDNQIDEDALVASITKALNDKFQQQSDMLDQKLAGFRQELEVYVNTSIEPVLKQGGVSHLVLVADPQASYWTNLQYNLNIAEEIIPIKVALPPEFPGTLPKLVPYQDGKPLGIVADGPEPVNAVLREIRNGTSPLLSEGV